MIWLGFAGCALAIALVLLWMQWMQLRYETRAVERWKRMRLR
jgi:hypothetical protein